MIQSVVFFLMNFVEVVQPLIEQIIKKIKNSFKLKTKLTMNSTSGHEQVEDSVLDLDAGKESFDNEISNE